MTLVDDIKARLDLASEIEARGVALRRAGKNLVGLCPFHREDTHSFTVFPDSQRWRCFGACNTGGDLFDFMMKQENLDFAETLRQLARKAGIPLHSASPNDHKALELKRQAEAVFGAAAVYFQQALKAGPGRDYALQGRGWLESTLLESGVGYFGKDWDGLRGHLSAAGIDLECPAAVALVGYRGDVAAWGQRHAVKPASQWVADGKIPAMPPHLLIYTHLVRGRVVYLSGRYLPVDFLSAEGQAQKPAGGRKPKSWNPPVELIGERQPFFNQCWWSQRSDKIEDESDAERKARLGLIARLEKLAVVTEGQGDAVSLGEWQVWAAATCGVAVTGQAKSSTDNILLSELKRKAAAGARVLIGFSRDEAGEKGTRAMAEALLAAGLNALQIGVIRWPAHDANDWQKELKNEGTAGSPSDIVLAFLEASPTWLQLLTDAAAISDDKQQDQDAVRTVFAALSGLDTFEVARFRDDLCVRLGLRQRMFDSLLKAARREAGQSEDGQPRYFVEAGKIMTRYFDSAGNEVLDALCNFSATIAEDVLRDNGKEVEREFRIAGTMGKRTLPAAKVKVSEFSNMGWILREWGSRAIVEAGRQKGDQLRAAIQHLSRDVQRRTIYTHTGWREIENQRAFLSSAGALGMTGVEVELDTDLELYRLPLAAEDPAGAMRLSLNYLDIAPARVAYPLWAAMFLAPLRELINVAFALWVFGASGTMKSTYAALALNHFGVGFDDKHLPAGFADTANRLEQKAFVVKDMPLIVDDFAPQKDQRSYSEYTQKAHRLVRDAGNLTGRGRLTADARARTTYIPRSLVIITGEDLPESESLVARLYVVEVNRGDIERERLSALQGQRERLGHAMSGYLAWAAESWSGWQATLPDRWRAYRQKAFGDGMHLRLPETVAGLMLGVEMGLRYAAVLGVINDAEYRQRLALGWEALTDGARAMLQRVRDEKPEELFTRTIGSLLTQGKIYLRGRNGGAALGGPDERSEMLGWYDENYYYLMPDAAYSKVASHFREQGNVFPVREVTLRKMLLESGMLVISPDGHRTQVITLDKSPQRVLVLKKTAFDAPAAEENKEMADYTDK